MDKLVRTIGKFAIGDLVIGSVYNPEISTVLKSGIIEEATGSPNSNYTIKLIWKQNVIKDVTDRTMLSVFMYFCNKVDWSGVVYPNSFDTYINIGSNSETLISTVNLGPLPNEYSVMESYVEIPLTTSRINISARCTVTSLTPGSNLNYITCESDIDLYTVTEPPPQPTNVRVVSGSPESGSVVSLAWNASYTSTSYDLGYVIYVNSTNTTAGPYLYKNIGNKTTGVFEFPPISLFFNSIKFLVRAKNSLGVSNWTSTGYLFKYGTKIFTDSQGQTARGTVKVYTGIYADADGWTDKTYINVWNGTKWVPSK